VAETPAGKLLGITRLFWIVLLVAGVTSIQFFTTPTPIRLANLILMG